MKIPSKSEQRNLVRQWDVTGRELEQIRRKALRGLPYCWTDVDALLELGATAGRRPRFSSGMIEMQRLFMQARRQKPRP